MKAKLDLSKALFGGDRRLDSGRFLLSYHKENHLSRAHHFSIFADVVHRLP